jgi:hypothetical protein
MAGREETTFSSTAFPAACFILAVRAIGPAACSLRGSDYAAMDEERGRRRSPTTKTAPAGIAPDGRRDSTHRCVRAQWPCGGSQPGRTERDQFVPTVFEPFTHGPSSGCGNLQWASFS